MSLMLLETFSNKAKEMDRFWSLSTFQTFFELFSERLVRQILFFFLILPPLSRPKGELWEDLMGGVLNNFPLIK